MSYGILRYSCMFQCFIKVVDLGEVGVGTILKIDDMILAVLE